MGKILSSGQRDKVLIAAASAGLGLAVALIGMQMGRAEAPAGAVGTTSGATAGDTGDVVLCFKQQTDTLGLTEVRPLGPAVMVGDFDGSGSIDVDDAVAIIEYCLSGGAAPPTYRMVAQAYVRTFSVSVLFDAEADTIIRLLSPHERGEVYYVPMIDTAGGSGDRSDAP